MRTIHYCPEVRTGIWSRTICGVEVRQREDRAYWETRAWKEVAVTINERIVDCARCLRALG